MIQKLLKLVSKVLPAREIKDGDGALYLTRFRVLGAMQARHPWFPISVYLHRFHRPDNDRELHNHPWPWAVSLILSGGYLEQRFAKPHSGLGHLRWLRAGSLNVLTADTFHRILELDGEPWTLFVVARKVQPWGYYITGRGFVPWRQHEAEKEAAHHRAPN
jgi:hypothetical protein